MANSSADVNEGEIREGLLCPICKNDLKTVDQLQEHFEVSHSTEDHAVFQSLKGLFDKAKRKILKQDSVDNNLLQKATFEPETSFNFKAETSDMTWAPQHIGLTISHTQYFKKLREKKINRYVIETNKLLIRLSKLICDISGDPEKRKEFERSIVPWVADSDVPLCPGCGKSFGLSRRWHHCRLCGYVMCNSCSFFLTYDFARKLTLPSISDDQCIGLKTNMTPRKASSVSLMSVVNLGSEQNIRICKDCSMLLHRHDKLVEQKKHKPLLVQVYEKLQECMREIEKLVPIYLEMIESLNLGETQYQLQDVQELKVKITRFAEKIDSHSKKIIKLESPEEGEPSNRATLLHSGIRKAATQFVQNMVLGLPSPPTPDDLARYQSERLDQVHRRIQQEKEAEMIRNQKAKQQSSKSPSPSKSPSWRQVSSEPVSPDTGWCVTTADDVREEDDPMMEQINNIQTYIKQARQDHKYDEIKMLENNLKELQLEHSRQLGEL